MMKSKNEIILNSKLSRRRLSTLHDVLFALFGSRAWTFNEFELIAPSLGFCRVRVPYLMN